MLRFRWRNSSRPISISSFPRTRLRHWFTTPIAPTGPIAITGYSEPSLTFLLGTDTRLLPPQEAALRALGDAAPPAGTVSGLDYSNGTHVTLTLFERR